MFWSWFIVKNSWIIMFQLQVQVFSSPDTRRNDKVLFERIIELPDGVDIPFSSLLKDLKFMYGQSVIVSFSVL